VDSLFPNYKEQSMNQFRFIGIVPLGIGVSVLFFLWTASGFGAPPLIFKVFGSFIALGFVMFGGAMLFGTSLLQQQEGRMAGLIKRVNRRVKDSNSTPPSEKKVGYDCANCGAALGPDAEVSPSGDVKCSYCKRWFNIHNS
jgi:DNA-directed RNA polymerase subunit RPC12/RpoP